MSYYIVHGEDQSLEEDVIARDRASCQAINKKKKKKKKRKTVKVPQKKQGASKKK